MVASQGKQKYLEEAKMRSEENMVESNNGKTKIKKSY